MELLTAGTAVYLLSNALIIFSYYRVYGVYFDRNGVNRWLEIGCFVTYYLINSTCFILFATPYLNLATSIIPMIGITFLYPGRMRTKFAVPLLCYGFSMILDNFTWYLFLQFALGTEKTVLLASLSGSITWHFIALVLCKRKAPAYDHHIEFLHWLAICAIPVGSVVVIAGLLYSGYTIEITLITSFVLLFINVLVFYLFDTLGKYYTDRNEKQLLQQQNRAYSDQFALMREAEQQVRTLRHDMKNHLSILRQYADEGRTEELEQYLDAFALKLSPKAEYVATGNRELDSILNYKLGQAEAAGAVLTLDVSLPEQLVVDVFDLNVVLGNLLDNATEGVAGSSDKGLSLYLRLDRGVLYIKLTNAYDGVVNIERTADALRYRTRKQDSTLHGLGLESVRATVEKYHGYLEISHQDKQFTVEAVLYTA